ncbi:hypothetical protein OF122_07310 [Pelagibacterium flavum]|uniref:Uncharacterized protein n=1 Tax=Pelagibacterium flavum TaxID=2984530 RepID=A0ABY6IVV3_9HYPH|nr:hypothetical protein [Pelagibacterium sp. YIM 151497]UYQ73554.1 hypothetical protein OF122_07310 [Pelagibacterium sp. YIM 151497]
MKRPKSVLIVDYPWVVVRVQCNLCRRNGQYRLARLAEKFGAETSLAHMLDLLAADCPWTADRFKAQKYRKGCGIHLPDIERDPTPPDLPPALGGLQIIEGGKKRAAG